MRGMVLSLFKGTVGVVSGLLPTALLDGSQEMVFGVTSWSVIELKARVVGTFIAIVVGCLTTVSIGFDIRKKYRNRNAS